MLPLGVGSAPPRHFTWSVHRNLLTKGQEQQLTSESCIETGNKSPREAVFRKECQRKAAVSLSVMLSPLSHILLATA